MIQVFLKTWQLTSKLDCDHTWPQPQVGQPATAPPAGAAGTAAPSSGAEEITVGSQVCQRKVPMYYSGSIGFTVAGGVPKVGQLLDSAWNITDTCRFKIMQVRSSELCRSINGELLTCSNRFFVVSIGCSNVFSDVAATQETKAARASQREGEAKRRLRLGFDASASLASKVLSPACV